MKMFSSSSSTRFLVKRPVKATVTGGSLFVAVLCAATVSHAQSALPSLNAQPPATKPAVVAKPTPRVTPSPTSDRTTSPARSFASVAGVRIQELSDVDAVALLQQELSAELDEKVTLTDGYSTWTSTRRELGARLPLLAMIKEARTTTDDVPLRFVVELDDARRTLRTLIPKVNRVVSGKAEGVLPTDTAAPRRPLRATLALEGSVLRVQRSLTATPPEDLIELVVGFVPVSATATPSPKPTPSLPTITGPTSGPSPYKAAPHLLSHFSTPYDASIVGRTENLRLAAKFMNGAVVKPGKVFSTNLAIGQRRASQGWKEAKMFMGGRIVTGMASGICQSSTTIYNAALLAGLPIVERHAHTFRVNYAPASRDAAIYWGAKDLKFRNNTSGVIMVRTYLKSKRFHVELYGTKPIEKEIEISSKILSQEKGVRSEAFRTIRVNGKSKVEKLSRDYYRPYPTT